MIGSGAREHALLQALRKDPGVDFLAVAPGNAGTATVAEQHDVDATSPQDVTDLARRLAVDLVVIGPEVPLVRGVADGLRAAGIACFGPSRDAARIKGSKAFAKDVMAAAGVRTAVSETVDTPARLDAALDRFGPPAGQQAWVVKDDGLAAGKGVVVTSDRAEALAHARSCLARGNDAQVVVEEFLDGPEVSLFGITDGSTVLALQPAQDFKRVGEGDEGPNTGGMGAYAPLPWAPAGLVDDVTQRVLQPVVDAMHRRGTPFSGLLYAGLAMTSRGVRVIEFNARFGDPETQVVLANLRTPLGRLLMAAATGGLDALPPLVWQSGFAVTVVVASEGYPAAPRFGDVVTGLAEAAEVAGVEIFHAGTTLSDGGEVVSSGGRVLSVTAHGASLASAREHAYAAVDLIRLEGSHHRRDIAERASLGE